MKVFKFGGASVKDAKSVLNVVKILKSKGYKNTFLVISAMGKMTNAFEAIVGSYINDSKDLNEKIVFVRDYHQTILEGLFTSNHPIYQEIELLFLEITRFFIHNKNKNYNFIYDQVVIFGELISTKIISACLLENNIENTWLDARQIIETNANYRNALVNLDKTCFNLKNLVPSEKLCITQGFIAGTKNASYSTTLGREGSDYSAAIIAYCLNASSLTIWKDVPGVLNADPRYFEQTELLDRISYREALEMAFYGASVIHPKTIKPLENKNIPLFVRSFSDISKNGTLINKDVTSLKPTTSYTYKADQILLSIATKDFSFMIEHNISHIFKLFTDHQIIVNLMQNSAISFSVCIEDPYLEFNKLESELSNHYKVKSYSNVGLISIRHFSKKDIKKVLSEEVVLLRQQSDETAQFVVNKRKY